MTEEQALPLMVPPSRRRRNAYLGGIIQVWTTRRCDKACFGCTQGSQLAGKPPHITVDQFERAVISLKDYWGVVGVFGGNPCVHPEFESLCEVLRRHIPQHRCGLWCNKLFGHGPICRRTFNPNHSNLNVHLDEKAYWEFRRDWPEARVFGLTDDSRHDSPYKSMIDAGVSEEERWDRISRCDINQYWSAMIGVFRDEPRGYFCEVAGAMSMLHQDDPGWPDTGIPIERGWWRRPMNDFRGQVHQCCHHCWVPMKGRGELAADKLAVEVTTPTHAEIYQLKRKGRELRVVERPQNGAGTVACSTNYLGNAKE